MTDLPATIPDDVWVTVGAHRYATTGRIIVREDGPRPDALMRYTYWSKEDVSDYLHAVATTPADPHSEPARFDARNAMLLGPSARLVTVEGVPVGATFDDDGSIVSVVACVRADLVPCCEIPKVCNIRGELLGVGHG